MKPAFLLLAVFAFASIRSNSASTSGEGLVKWIRQCGGLVDLEVDVVNEEGMRGTKAVRSMEKNQIAIHLPAHLTVLLGGSLVSSAENAANLLRLQKHNPEWNQSMAPYWNSLPDFGTSKTKLTYPLESLQQLQDPVLAAYITVHAAEARSIFEGGRPDIVEDFAADFPEVTYEHFSHLASVVASYAFLFPNELGEPYRMMLPLLDLVNHGDGDKANAEIIMDANGDLYMYAKRDIAAGEEILHQYNPGLRRNDQSLFHYGFIQRQDAPLMVSRDLPGGNLNDPPKYTEDDYGYGGRLVSRAELARLEELLRSFPTTHEEDARLLSGGKQGGWAGLLERQTELTQVERMFVEYRMLRKQAIALAIRKLTDALLISREL